MKLLALAVFTFCIYAVNAQTNMVFGYYGSWAIYRPGAAKFNIDDIDVTKYSHLTYAFIGLKEDGTVNILDHWADVDLGGFRKFVDLKKRNVSLKVLISMGGWNEGSERYSRVLNDPVKRTRLINSIHEFLLRWGFDGFDFDWEYPTKRGGIRNDVMAYINFLRELRIRLGSQFLITAAVGADPSLIGTSYIVPEMNRYLDYINLMTYDYNSYHNGKTGLNSPLFSSKNAPNSFNIDSTLKLWIQSGASPSKLLIGLGFYGQSFTLSNRKNNGLGAPSVGPGKSGQYSGQLGLLTYLEICLEFKSGGWIKRFDHDSKTPYATKGDQWIGYDDPLSIRMKTEYAVKNRLAGVMIWTVDYEDRANVCGYGENSLLTAIKNVIRFYIGIILSFQVTFHVRFSYQIILD